MQDHAAIQIEAIHSMLTNGHRSVRLERHSMILWGLTAAFLILFVNAVFTREHIPLLWQRSLASNGFITLVVILVAYWDFRLTRQQRELRDETLSFIQVQLTKVWWSLIGLIILINLGMNFFGGKYLFYPIMIALAGLGFYIQGLFSQQLLAWNGILMILLGLACLILQTPYPTMEWLTIILAGLGVPLLAWLIDIPVIQQKLSYRLISSVGWLCLVTLPTWAIHQSSYQTPRPDWPQISLQDYRQQAPAQQEHVVRIPAGTQIPFGINIRGETLASVERTVIPLTLKRPLDVTVSKGKLDGRYRVENGNWVHPRRKFVIKERQLATQLTDKEGVKIELDFLLEAIER